MKRLLLLIVVMLYFLPYTSARNPKYEKMLKHFVRHQKKYVVMDD